MEPHRAVPSQKGGITNIDYYYYRQQERSVMRTTSTRRRLDSLFRVTGKLFEFADQFDFTEEDSELKSWMYVNIYRLYSWAFALLPEMKDDIYTLPAHHLERFRQDSSRMIPEAQHKCRDFFLIAEAELQKFTGMINNNRRFGEKK